MSFGSTLDCLHAQKVNISSYLQRASQTVEHRLRGTSVVQTAYFRGFFVVDITKADLRDRLGNIDQIRDILFGSQLREYSTRLEQLESDLSVLQQEIRDRTDEVKQVLSTELQASVEGIDKRFKTFTVKDNDDKNELRQQIETLNKRLASNMSEIKQELSFELKDSIDTLEKRIKTLTAKDQEEKSELHQQVDLLSKRLNSGLANLDESVESQVTSLRNDFLSSREKLQEDLMSLRQQIYEVLDQRMNFLASSKVAREDFAELLFEIGLRLKGTEFVPRLKEAASSTSDSASDTNEGYIAADS